jgi:hypothetical protein
MNTIDFSTIVLTGGRRLKTRNYIAVDYASYDKERDLMLKNLLKDKHNAK